MCPVKRPFGKASTKQLLIVHFSLKMCNPMSTEFLCIVPRVQAENEKFSRVTFRNGFDPRPYAIRTRPLRVPVLCLVSANTTCHQ